MAYCIVETNFHAGAALFTLLGWSPLCFPEIMHRPWKSDSIHSFWSHRWHALLSPIFLLLTSPLDLLSLPSTLTSTLRVSAIFLLSGLYHEFGLFPIFRYLSSSPTYAFTHPGVTQHTLWDVRTHVFTGFFAAQAVPFLAERLWKKITGRRVGGGWGFVWCWCWLFGTGRWVSRACRDSGIEGVVAGWVREAWGELLRSQGAAGWIGTVDGSIEGVQAGTRGVMKAVGW